MNSTKIKELTPLLDQINKADPFTLEGVYLARVTDVYDGDTCKASLVGILNTNKPFEFRIRMLGYNAEEIKQSTKLDEQTRQQNHAIAVSQRDALSAMILNQLVVVDVKKFDAFGRLLAFVYPIHENIQSLVSVSHSMIEKFPNIKLIPYE